MLELNIQGVNKKYKNGVHALNDVNITLKSGMIGLLGPNGAGKSTLMRTIATLQNPDEGDITFNGKSIFTDKVGFKSRLGYLPQEFGFYNKLSAVKLLEHYAILKGITDKKERREVIEKLLHITNLYNFRHNHVADYSGGMKQRFGIAQALLGNPEVIIVDEPTAGLDPLERNKFHNLLSEIGQDNIVILSTHIVDDVENLCKRMLVMNRGTILYDGSPQQAKESIQGKIWQQAIDKPDYAKFAAEYKVISHYASEGLFYIRVYSDIPPGNGFEEVRAGLEDFYFSVI